MDRKATYLNLGPRLSVASSSLPLLSTPRSNETLISIENKTKQIQTNKTKPYYLNILHNLSRKTGKSINSTLTWRKNHINFTIITSFESGKTSI